MNNYLQRYRTACSSFNGDEAKFEKEMKELFTEALEAGDRRMAMELQDSIVTAVEVGAPVNGYIYELALLTKHFPDVAQQTIEIIASLEN